MTKETKITYCGHSLFVIESINGTKIGFDPYNEQVKSNLPHIEADIILVSHSHFDHSNFSLFKGRPTVTDQPGKTTIAGINIEGISVYHDESKGSVRGKNIIFKVEVDGIKFAHLGDLGHIPGDEIISQLLGTNILMIPVGGIFTIDFKKAFEVIKKIKPSVAIPMHFKERHTKININTIDNFLDLSKDYKVMEHTISINKDSLPKNIEIWVLKSS